MSSITLTLSSDSSQLCAEYFPPIDISDGNYVCGLIDFQTFNTIPNVDETNNLFYFNVDREVKKKVYSNEIDAMTSLLGANTNESTEKEKMLRDSIEERLNEVECNVIPTGAYEVKDIHEYLAKELKKFNVELNLIANKNTLKCEMNCSESVDFSMQKSIGSLLGFAMKQYEGNTTHVSELTAKILNMNVIRIECNLIKGAYINNTPVHTIHQFSPRVPPGFKIVEVPNNVIYFPVATKIISSLNISLVDQDNNSINFQGETITIRVHIKKIK